MNRVLSLFFLVACTTTPPPMQSQPRPNQPTPAPTPEPSTPSAGSAEDHHHNTPPTPKPAGAAIGETCGPDDACVAGSECVKYFGIAGARGPQFKTCEIKCGGKGGTCPADRKCVTIADGPGSVCR